MASPTSIPSLSTFRRALHAFSTSSSFFHVLHTLPLTSVASPPSPLKSLHILDASFNPPTRAHLQIATSALAHDPADNQVSKHLLLLLATQNADKPTLPASLEQRLVMMTILAQDIIQELQHTGTNQANMAAVHVDVAVTKKPYFVDKAIAITESGVYPSDVIGKSLEQVHLIGFDTLLRLLDPKYYPHHNLAPLESFFEKCRVRVTMRTGDAWGGLDGQNAYVKALADRTIEERGGRKEWAKRIELVEGNPEAEQIVSSTKARDAAGKHSHDTLSKLVTKEMKRYILDEKLYSNDQM